MFRAAEMLGLTLCISAGTQRNSRHSGMCCCSACRLRSAKSSYGTGYTLWYKSKHAQLAIHYAIACCREAEVIHARWAMLGVLGLIIPDILGAPLYMLPELGTQRLMPFTIIVVVAFGGLEVYRVQSIWQGRDLNSRVYPGGKQFDPLGLAKRQPAGQKEADSPGTLHLDSCGEAWAS